MQRPNTSEVSPCGEASSRWWREPCALCVNDVVVWIVIAGLCVKLAPSTVREQDRNSTPSALAPAAMELMQTSMWPNFHIFEAKEKHNVRFLSALPAGVCKGTWKGASTKEKCSISDPNTFCESSSTSTYARHALGASSTNSWSINVFYRLTNGQRGKSYGTELCGGNFLALL